jgi:hypothetical protein
MLRLVFLKTISITMIVFAFEMPPLFALEANALGEPDRQPLSVSDTKATSRIVYYNFETYLSIIPACQTYRFKDLRFFAQKDLALANIVISGRREYKGICYGLTGQGSMWSVDYLPNTRIEDTLAGGSLSYQSIFSSYVTMGKRLPYARGYVMPYLGCGITLYNYLQGTIVGDTNLIKNNLRSVAYGLTTLGLTCHLTSAISIDYQYQSTYPLAHSVIAIVTFNGIKCYMGYGFGPQNAKGIIVGTGFGVSSQTH